MVHDCIHDGGVTVPHSGHLDGVKRPDSLVQAATYAASESGLARFVWLTSTNPTAIKPVVVVAGGRSALAHL
jgi:hypothetical protein